MGNHTAGLAPDLHDFHPEEDELREFLLTGLRRPQKELPSLYFYDERGSQLFDAICELPEYYPTRTELAIMSENIEDIAEQVGTQASLIEFGSGSSLKTRVLLDHLHELAAYVPVDISKEHLQSAAGTLARKYPGLEILPVCADFTERFDLPAPKIMPIRNVVYFPGSTIGNFDFVDAHKLLVTMRRIAKAGGAALIGADLKKDPAVLESAYNDAQGVTASFNLNMLVRLNRELAADFDVDAFRHRAVWNERQGCIEMHLVSTRAQIVTVAGERIAFVEGEHILTERSHKYSLEEFSTLARTAGFEVGGVWTDPKQLFSVQYLVVR